MAIRDAQRDLLAVFVAQTARRMADRGWELDPAAAPDPSSIFLGSFRRPVAPDFVATVEFMLESTLAGGFDGFRRLTTPRVRVGVAVGVRHLPTERLIHQLDWHGEVDISRELADIVGDEPAPPITDEETADRASLTLVELVEAHAMTFATAHASIDAMVAFIAGGEQLDRDEEFACEFVPALLAASGNTDRARVAVAGFRARPRPDPASATRYGRFADLLLGWIDNSTPLN